MDDPKNKKPPRISNVAGVLMVVVAVIMDLLGPIGAVGGAVIFFIWFAMLNIPLIGPKQLVRWFLNLLGEAITAGVWAGMTVGVLLVITMTRAEDKLGINVLGKINKARVTVKSLKRMKNKALRRMANPERTARAQERLQRMRDKGLNPGGGAVRSRQPMKDITVPKKAPNLTRPVENI